MPSTLHATNTRASDITRGVAACTVCAVASIVSTGITSTGITSTRCLQ
ncbi:MAG: hypothetical protein ACK4ZJ_17755 [Allorhizobium sp.]